MFSQRCCGHSCSESNHASASAEHWDLYERQTYVRCRLSVPSSLIPSRTDTEIAALILFRFCQRRNPQTWKSLARLRKSASVTLVLAKMSFFICSGGSDFVSPTRCSGFLKSAAL